KQHYSLVSMQWLAWLNATVGDGKIRHAEHMGGEFTIPNPGPPRKDKFGKWKLPRPYSVDGYCAETKTVYEFHGCLFHGCKNCYRTFIMRGGDHCGNFNDPDYNDDADGEMHRDIEDLDPERNMERRFPGKDPSTLLQRYERTCD